MSSVESSFTVQKSVEPHLTRIESFAQSREIADYWSFNNLTLRDGVTIRYGYYIASQPMRGYVLMLLDHDTFIEEQGEIAEDFARRGWQLWCLEWRGQGRVMEYETDPDDVQLTPEVAEKVGLAQPQVRKHLDTTRWYEHCVYDLDEFWNNIWRPQTTGIPCLVLAQGVGAHHLLKWLVRVYRRRFEQTALVIMAPEVQPRTWGLPISIAYSIASLMSSIFYAAPFPGQEKRKITNLSPQAGFLTHDPVRLSIMQKWRKKMPELAAKSYSWGRLAEAFSSSLTLQRALKSGGSPWGVHWLVGAYKYINAKGDFHHPISGLSKWANLKKRWRDCIGYVTISLPTLLMFTPNDKMIDVPTQYLLVDHFSRARLTQFPRAGHALLHEEEAIRKRVWREIDHFLDRVFDNQTSEDADNDAQGAHKDAH